MKPFATPLHEAVHRFITRGEGSFEALALEVFAYQFHHNAPYRRFCQEQGIVPEKVQDWRDIPAVPTAAFKVLPLTCRPPEEAEALFLSSGTTQGPQSRSRHYVFDLRLYHAAIRDWFARHLLPDLPPGKRILTLVLMPSPQEQPTSSLGYMLGYVLQEFGTPGSDFFVRRESAKAPFRLEMERLAATLQALQEPMMLLGPSSAFVLFLEWCQGQGLRFCLPAGSRLMDTGGPKGHAWALSQEELYRRCEEMLGIPQAYCVNEYGMSEMLSQFYDSQAGQGGPRLFLPPPWVRTQVLDPETLRPLPSGGVGVLRHWDLANVDSALVLQTEDLGQAAEEGFLLLGRASQAEAKGCSLLLEEWLQRA